MTEAGIFQPFIEAAGAASVRTFWVLPWCYREAVGNPENHGKYFWNAAYEVSEGSASLM